MDKLGPLRPGQVRISGEDIDLNPDATHALGMALHELYANSRAHGALANAEGRLAIDWARTGDGVQEALRITWRETNSAAFPGLVVDPFGRFLVTVNLPRSLNGKVGFTPQSDGFVCVCDLPIAQIHAYERSGAAPGHAANDATIA